MEKISSGNADLDEWLQGGYENDIITTLYGPAGSGKTNLCLIAASNIASKGKKVIFIDTEGGFSVERLKQISNSEEKAENILILRATTFKEQCEAFNKLLENLKNIGLIVVDSIAMLYRLELGSAASAKDEEKIHGVNRALARQLRILSEIARKKNIPVLVTNQVYSSFIKEGEQSDSKVHMVGGDILKYWSKCLIELQSVSSGKRKAIMRKHRYMPEKEFSFNIIDRGIAKLGFRFF